MSHKTDSSPSLSKQLSLIEQFTQNAYNTINTVDVEHDAKNPSDLSPLHETPNCNTTQSIQLTNMDSDRDDVDNSADAQQTSTISQDNGYTRGNRPPPAHTSLPIVHGAHSLSPHVTTSGTSIDFTILRTNTDEISNLYITLYYMLRLVSVIVTLFLAIMAINYAIGQVFTLSAADLFCPDNDADTVRDYNLQQNDTRGTADSCGKIHRPEIDAYKVQNGDPYEYESDVSSGNVLGCAAFSILALCLIAVSLYHFYICMFDAFYHCIRKDAENNPRLINASTAANAVRTRPQNKCMSWYQGWNLWLFKHNYPDSKMKILTMILSEISEILMQCWALLIYGGVQSVSFSFVIGNEAQFVKSFSIIVGSNAILAGVLWIIYSIKTDSSQAMFHGTGFQAVVFVIDMLFDFVYTIFPFTLYSGNASLLFNIKALATLHSENGILFVAAFIAMVLLLQKCYSVLSSFDPVQIIYRAHKMDKHNIDLVPYLQTVSTEDSDDKQQCKRKCCITSIGVLFVLCGICIITVVNIYLNNAQEICSNPSEALLAKHPELFYWNRYCQSKITPFDTSETPCDCRIFQISVNSSHYEQYNFSKQHIVSITSNFKMMHFLEIEYDHSLILIADHMEASHESALARETFHLNLTANCFASKHLRSLTLHRIFVQDLDWKSLASLKLLQVLQIIDAQYQNPVDWDSIGQLTELKYLNLRESTKYLDGQITDSLCRLKSLRYLDLETSFITKVPDCIGQLQQLYGVSFRGLLNVHYVTPELFRLPNIVTIKAYFAGLNASSIPDDTWGESLNSVFLQDNALCNQMDLMTPLQLKFMETFDPCYEPCGKSGSISSGICTMYEWGDGHCHEDCCDYDGGDCYQTCECDKSLWLNDECDLECNNTLCAYDFGACIPDVSSNITDLECVAGSGCYDDWIEDGWCDNDCAVLDNEECDDAFDCNAQNQCNQDSECSTAYLYVIHTLASATEPKELVNQDEACGVFWEYIKLGVDGKNCTEAFTILDVNHDGYISFWEAMQTAYPFFGLTQQKAHQINCSLCLEDPSLYY
eukprot:193628_1